MKAAVIVGINYYEHGNPLYGCVNDAYSVKSILERNADGSINFECKLLTASASKESIDRVKLIDIVKQLFAIELEVALFYFSGHGYAESTGGFLMTSEAARGDQGVPLAQIISLAKRSPARNKIIILDSCHSGTAGDNPDNKDESLLTEGLTVLASSTKDQYSVENGSGVFTNLMVDALAGGAADLLGNVTPGSIYAHIDQSLGAFEQRPIFKTNVRSFVSLRKVVPPISIDDLRKIAELFPVPGFEFGLNPTFEEDMIGRPAGVPLPIGENVIKYKILQKYNRLNLLVPVNAPHMWHAAMESKSCKLTALGEHYRRLAKKGRLG
ncbi:MAG: caspase family protein [Ginsengibacter sp.]